MWKIVGLTSENQELDLGFFSSSVDMVEELAWCQMLPSFKALGVFFNNSLVRFLRREDCHEPIQIQ